MNLYDSYGISPHKIIESDKGYIIETSKGKLLLRQSCHSEGEISSSAAIIDYVNKRGFNGIATIIRNNRGKPYIKDEDRLYILTNWTHGDKLKIRDLSNALILSNTIGEFHNAALGFSQPQGIKTKVFWGKRMEKYKVMACKLEKYSDYLNQKHSFNEFEGYSVEYINVLCKRAKESLKILRSAEYLKTLEKSMKNKEICVNIISDNTAIIGENGALIVKPYDLGYNMIEEDIADLIKKVIEETGDISCVNEILNNYQGLRNIDDKSERIIRALVTYPYDSIKIINRYMKDMDKDDMLLEKFKKYIGKEKFTNVLEV